MEMLVLKRPDLMFTADLSRGGDAYVRGSGCTRDVRGDKVRCTRDVRGDKVRCTRRYSTDLVRCTRR